MSCPNVPMERPLSRTPLNANAGFFGFFDDATVEQVNGAFGEVRVTRVVGHHADGGAVAVEVAEKFHDGFAVLGVQVTSRLVGHQDERIADQSAGHGDTLLLTAGELRRVVPEAVGHADAFEGVLDLLLALGGARAAIGQRQLDVFVDGEVADEVERLEDEADFAVADAGALADGELADWLAVQHVAAVARGIEQSKNREQRRLAAARRPSDGNVRAFLDLEMNLLERVRLDFIRVENFLYAFHLDKCWCV